MQFHFYPHTLISQLPSPVLYICLVHFSASNQSLTHFVFSSSSFQVRSMPFFFNPNSQKVSFPFLLYRSNQHACLSFYLYDSFIIIFLIHCFIQIANCKLQNWIFYISFLRYFVFLTFRYFYIWHVHSRIAFLSIYVYTCIF
jgi:hypothetical protein